MHSQPVFWRQQYVSGLQRDGARYHIHALLLSMYPHRLLLCVVWPDKTPSAAAGARAASGARRRPLLSVFDCTAILLGLRGP